MEYRHSRLQLICDDMLARERWPRHLLLEYQQKRLRAMLRHAASSSPYYREIISDPEGEVALADLPTLDKQILMEQWNRIVTDPRLRLEDAERHLVSERATEPLALRYQVAASGGTSGVQGVAAYDPLAWEIAVAAVQRAMATQEVTPTARVVGIGSPSPIHMTYRLFGALRAVRGESNTVPRLSVTTPIPEVVAALNALQPEAVCTYPSFIRRLAEEQQAGRLRISPRKFSSTAETLTEDVREIARETWNASVLNLYGATEVNLIGTECPWTTGLHVPEDLIVLEVVDENYRPVPPGVVGNKILVTTLYNRTFPMIRYELSDLVSLAEGPCPCGRVHLRLGSIEGRKEEMLQLPARDGGHIKIHAMHLRALLVRVPSIRQFDVAGRDENLLIRVALKDMSAVGEVLPGLRRTLEGELHRLGAEARVTVEPVAEIARSGNGAKQKLVRAAE